MASFTVIEATHENVVILNPVRPNVAVHAGIMHVSRLTGTIIAKLLQKLRPMSGPTIPALNVAAAILALSLGVCSVLGSDVG